MITINTLPIAIFLSAFSFFINGGGELHVVDLKRVDRVFAEHLRSVCANKIADSSKFLHTIVFALLKKSNRFHVSKLGDRFGTLREMTAPEVAEEIAVLFYANHLKSGVSMFNGNGERIFFPKLGKKIDTAIKKYDLAEKVAARMPE